MSNERILRNGYYFIGLITLAIWSVLGYNHFHGGVPSHHLLADPTLPTVSNWWGGLLLPLLAGLAVYRVRKRLRQNGDQQAVSQVFAKTFTGFAFAAVFGVAIASLFILQQSQWLDYLVMTLPLLAILFPLYRIEFILGFVIAMTYTFGAVLPTAFASVVALMSAILYLGLRPLILWIVSKVFSKSGR